LRSGRRESVGVRSTWGTGAWQRKRRRRNVNTERAERTRPLSAVRATPRPVRRGGTSPRGKGASDVDDGSPMSWKVRRRAGNTGRRKRYSIYQG
jgi:hypothetical protein